MPGDPLRAKWIAETFLDDAQCYNEVRGMYGFTGTWRGKRVSVEGSGMGQPSLAIDVNELFRDYGVESIIRVGSCGGSPRRSPSATSAEREQTFGAMIEIALTAALGD